MSRFGRYSGAVAGLALLGLGGCASNKAAPGPEVATAAPCYSQATVSRLHDELVAERKLRCAAEQKAATPVVQVEKEPGQVLVIPADVLFAFDQDQLLPAGKQKLDEAAAVLLKQPGKVVVEGYTDSVGSTEYNQGLSERRAASVRQYFIEKGVQGDRVDALGGGEEHPVANNDTSEGRAMNRRVEITVQNPRTTM